MLKASITHLAQDRTLKDIDIQPLVDLPGVGKNLQDHINIPITFHTKEKLGLSGKSTAEIEQGIEQWKNTRAGIITSNWAALGGHVKS